MAAIKRIELNGEVEREQIRIYTFGGFRWRLGGDPLEVPIGRPARELLAHLALSTGARRSRDALVGRFWPELSDRVARKQLSQAVWRANSAVRERLGQQLIVGRGEELHLAAEVWCDAVEATRLFGLGKDSAAERIVVLEEAVGLTSGRFLEGHRSAWADELAADYEASARGARRELIRLHRASGHPVAALRHAELLEVQFGDSGALLARADLLAELGRFDEATSIIERVQSGDLDQGEQRHFERLRRRIRRSLSAPTPSFGRLPFAGRNDERSRILSHLGRRTDDVRLVLLQGVPGIGKTRMLEELTGDLRWRGWEVLAATATTEHGPFGVLSDALADALTPARSRLLSDRVEPVFLGQAAGVLESLAPMVQERAASVDGREALLRTSESVCRIVEGLAAERPTTLIVDDVHIADPGTLSVLRRLPHLLAGRSVTLVVSFRAEEARARDEVWDVLEFLDRKPGALRHELVPLGREATRSLVDAVLGNGGETLVDAVHRASNGIPLAVSEALRRIASEPQSAPAELTGALASRMDSFGRDQRTLLEIAALMGTEASVDPLLECSNLDHGDALRALDTLLEDGVLRSRRLIYEFSHSLIRETVYEAIEVDRRVELHRLAADVLDRKGAHAGVVAQHREAGGQADEAAMLYLQAARDAGRANAFTGASDGYQRALRVLEDGHPAELDIIHEYDEILKIFGDEEGRRALLARLLTYDGRGQADGRALWRMADISAGSNAFEEAILYAKRATEWAKTTGDQALLATAARTEGEALSLLGDQSGAVERLQLAADLSSDPVRKSKALQSLGSVHAVQLDYREAEGALARALYIAEQAGDVPNLCSALNLYGTVLMEVGDTPGAQRLFDRTMELARSIGFKTTEAKALANSGMIAYFEGRPCSAVRYMAEAADRLHELERRDAECRTRGNLAQMLIDMVGAADEGERQARIGLEIADEIGDRLAMGQASDAIGRGYRARGEFGPARHHFDRAAAVAAEIGATVVELQALQQTALLDAEAERFAAAVAALRRTLEMSEEAEGGAMAPLMRATLGHVLARSGDAEAGVLDLRAASEAVGSGAIDAAQIDFWHWEAAKATGRFEEATSALSRAHRRLETIRLDFGEEWQQVATRVVLYRDIESAWTRAMEN